MSSSNGGRDSKGQFVKGGPGGPGRKAVPDFRDAVEAVLADKDMTVADAIAEVYEHLVEQSKGGCTRASEILLDRFCGKLKEEHHLAVSPAGPPPPCPSPLESGEWDSYAATLFKVNADLERRHNGHEVDA